MNTKKYQYIENQSTEKISAFYNIAIAYNAMRLLTKADYAIEVLKKHVDHNIRPKPIV